MLTIIGLFAGLILVVGLVILAMRTGTKGGRHAQSSSAVATLQEQNKDPRGSVRTSGGGND